MIALLSLFVAESLLFGLFWHNWSPRSEKERESEKRDPAVLFSRRGSHPQQRPRAGAPAARRTAGQKLTAQQSRFNLTDNEKDAQDARGSGWRRHFRRQLRLDQKPRA